MWRRGRMRDQAGEYKCRALTGLLIIFFIIYFRHADWFSNEIYIPQYETLDLKQYPDLGINAEEVFMKAGSLRIPRIIHQTWKHEQIPTDYVDWVKSWVQLHPDWTYMFWSDDSARQLIVDKYPALLSTYDSYTENIRRADALRYVVLHEYGGVYADMDMESLRPMDDIVRKYSCILPQEPYEHPILDKNSEALAMNSLLACRAKHPFMKQLIDKLPDFSHMWHVLDSTGPHYLTVQYKTYVHDSSVDPSHTDGVYLAPAEYFIPTIDPAKYPYFKKWCADFQQLSPLQKRACVTLKRKGLERKPPYFSFTDHHWSHTYFKSQKFSFSSPVSIFDIVPKTTMYERTGVKL